MSFQWCQSTQVKHWRQVITAFGRTGIPSFVLEEVLGELQAATSRHLSELAVGMTLELSATSARKSSTKPLKHKKLPKVAAAAPAAAAAAAGDADTTTDEDETTGTLAAAAAAATAAAAKEEVSKVVRVRSAGGELRQRSIAQLSGGERKRLALALGLGYAEVVAARGRLTSNVLVLDEVGGLAPWGV
jgi:ATPase subunit of ABC transporter with duplicated ATPase domains